MAKAATSSVRIPKPEISTDSTIRQERWRPTAYVGTVPTEFRDLLPAIAALADPRRQIALADVAAATGLSPSRVQRVMTDAMGESPKRFQRRTRLELAAVLLMATDARVIDVAMAAGFQNHETFTRAFTDRFGTNPRRWRAARPQALTPVQGRHLISTSRCMTLYHKPLQHKPLAHKPPSNQQRSGRKDAPMAYDIETRTVDPVPIVYQARSVAQDAIGEVLAEVLPAVFGFVMENGMAPAGHPFVRYADITPGQFHIEAGIPLVEPPSTPPADNDIVAGELQGGLAAVTMHRGPYEGLASAYTALERWITESSHEPNGAPWEIYMTDPGEVEDPADWLTEVFWPVI